MEGTGGTAAATILRVNHRRATGSLGPAGWRAVAAAGVIHYWADQAADGGEWAKALAAGADRTVAVEAVDLPDSAAVARRSVAPDCAIVWVVVDDPLAPPPLPAERAVLTEATLRAAGYDVCVVDETAAPPGAVWLDVVRAMDRLRGPGGCPWDAEQTHESLIVCLEDECAEVVHAITTGDADNLREELGDLALQVVFHAGIAATAQPPRFDIDAVMAELTDKLVRRHPHVFTEPATLSVAEVEARWEQHKAAERSRRRG